ncbi:cytochrome c, class I [Novosphingobium aromaticivorans DSM 12444]|jgi:mono/diheme cytochrome c family protein|uniref:Cytochrome c, class I n=1 Tax=Novosphingobium aromaticivorans (strain ATCC 700278 / DSM 12444 / CCUG 56034 / CIP 105152 / NBRC 16084 / F199) TaxID=279238 RepID=Q2G7P4_NOVAD|nr:cytochrome c [Novosphingobium aromaticivorans]ABD26129.1 cytochrome c, class I [Novosphingobium aromaticivorans DSM 12444]SCY58818.1 Cytochrome c [Novosphingobium aromaticivorans]
MKALFGLVPAAALLALALPADAAPDGATVFARCAACHTRTGAGVPGAYPPLGADFRALAAKSAGRRYLALAVIKGLSGPITVEGKPYRGVMPAQVLDDATTAAVLNHVGTQIAKTGPAFKPFTDKEVAGHRASGSGLSAADVAKLHAGVGGK